MPEYDAILFDFDGVLVDSEPLHYRCWREILAPYGFNMDWETYASTCIGISDRLMLSRFSECSNPSVTLEVLLDTYPQKRERFRELMEMEAPFFAGCLPFLNSLSGYKLAVVSSSGRTEIEPALERAGIRPLLHALVCGGDVKKHKPDPEPYLLAARLLNGRRPLVVEDSDVGEESGRSAGFDVVRVKRPAEVIEAVRTTLRNGAAARVLS